MLDDVRVFPVELAYSAKGFWAERRRVEPSTEEGVKGGNVAEHAEQDLRRQGIGDPLR
jgi:hypothetical protein